MHCIFGYNFVRSHRKASCVIQGPRRRPDYTDQHAAIHKTEGRREGAGGVMK